MHPRYSMISMMLPCFILWMGLPQHTAQAKRARACLHDRDCHSGQHCVRRRCVRRPSFRVNLKTSKQQAYPLAIAPVRWFGPTKKHKKNLIIHKVEKQLNANFRLLVGTFKLLKRKSFQERPPYNGIDLGTFTFAPWQNIGASGLIKIGIRAKDKDNLLLMCRFYDVDGGKMGVRIQATRKATELRSVLHKFSNKVYEYLLKRPGIFNTMIAYVRRNPKGGKDIWIMDFDGHNKRRVISNGALNLQPSWSPSGRYLYYTSYLTGRPYLYRLDLVTRRIRRITYAKGTYTSPRPSPNGKTLLFSYTVAGTNRDADIYISNPLGRGMRRLTTSWGIDTTPTWSKDGKKIAFVSERYTQPHIFVMDANGKNQARLTFKGNYNQEPRWSPSEDELLFTARDEFLKYDLFVIRFEKDSSGKVKKVWRRLTQNQGNNFEASWSPDGRYVLFVSTRYGERKLFIMNADGSKQRLFLRGRGDFQSPAWSPILKKQLLPGGRKGRSFYARTKLITSKEREDKAREKYAQRNQKPAPKTAEQLADEKANKEQAQARSNARTAMKKVDDVLDKADKLLKKPSKHRSAKKKKKTTAATSKKKKQAKKAKTTRQTPPATRKTSP